MCPNGPVKWEGNKIHRPDVDPNSLKRNIITLSSTLKFTTTVKKNSQMQR